MSNTFTHSPRPAIVPTEAKYSQLRRYGVPADAHGMHLQHDKEEPWWSALVVFRDGRQDVAELTIEIGLRTRASITARLTPDELRELAARLIDAAHDIETLPAAVLARTLEGGAA